ncbi:MAG: aldehyde dehydrogenase family protein [Acidimicrobiales bacterium]|nr:aldehyde dehydrogenase family protein [Acidimicrobiales bacterium]
MQPARAKETAWDPGDLVRDKWPGAVTSVIAGRRQPPGELELLPVVDPSSGATLVEVADADEAIVDQAVAAASAAFRSTWGRAEPAARGRALMSVAGALRDASEELARIETLDSGKPLSQARGDVATAARYFEFYAGMCDKLYGETIPQTSGLAYTVREPHGVVGVVTPWNSPLAQMCRSVAPALAAGNTVVVKPSELTPLTSTLAAMLFVAAGLPSGVCNVVPGRGPTAGDALCRHPSVKYVSFTGSVGTGRAVAAICADRVIPCSLELGGKSATIILPDADLAAAAEAGVSAVVRNAGQSCFATTRLVTHRAVHDELVARMVDLFDTLTIGPGIDDPALGPLISAAQANRARGYVERAIRDGASAANAARHDLPEAGFYVAPSLLVGVTNDMEVARDEVFGPVQSVIAVDDEEEAIEVANASAYGLAAGIFTSSLSAAHRHAARLEAGQVQINRYPLGGVDTPFGGYKQSGIGREKGLEALRHYSQIKTVILHLDGPNAR